VSTPKTSLQLAFLGGEMLIYLISGLLLYVVISRVAGPVLLGQYTLVLSWMLVFQALGNFGISELLMREFGRFSDQRSEYLGAGIILGATASITMIPLMVLASSLAGYDQQMMTALTIAALSLPGAMLLSVARSGFIAHQRVGFVFATRLFEFVLIVPLNLVLLIHGWGIEMLTSVLVTGRAVGALLALYLLHRHAIAVLWWPGWERVKALFPPAVTFATSNSLGIAGIHLNVIMLSLMAPVSAVGIFGAGFKLVEGMMLLTVLFGQFYLPQIANSLHSQRSLGLEPFCTPFRLLFAIMIPIGIGLVVFPDIPVRLIFGAEFEQTIDVLRIMGIFYLVYGLEASLSMILKAATLQRLDLQILVTNPMLNVIVNLALIPLFGALGAAIGQLCGGLCSATIRYVCVTRKISSPGWGRLVAPLLASSVLAGGIITVSSHLAPDWVRVALYCLAMLVMIGWTVRSAMVTHA
jgi:O-antigen/teichoic acid export membrane protein